MTSESLLMTQQDRERLDRNFGACITHASAAQPLTAEVVRGSLLIGVVESQLSEIVTRIVGANNGGGGGGGGGLLDLVLVRVTLTQVGGSAGSFSAYCSFTYSATYNGTEIISAANAQQPENSRARIAKMKCTAATKGTAYRNPGGTWTIFDADEQWAVAFNNKTVITAISSASTQTVVTGGSATSCGVSLTTASVDVGVNKTEGTVRQPEEV